MLPPESLQKEDWEVQAQFDTPKKRRQWWNELSTPWKNAFSQAVLRSVDLIMHPTDEMLMDILSRPALRFVGPTGINPNMRFQLQDMTGLLRLSHLEILVFSFHSVRELCDFSAFKNLKSLYLNNNELRDLSPLANCHNLRELICSDNEIQSLKALKNLRFLDSLNIEGNNLSELKGIGKKHKGLKEIFCKANPNLSWQTKREFENQTGIRCR